MPPPGVLVASTGDPWVRWDWVSRHSEEIAAALREHVELTALALLLGLVVSTPLALASVRWPRLSSPVLGVTGATYTIPSLALFAFLVPYTGLSRTTSLVGLVGYTLLILVRNLVAALDGVSPDVREAARAMGFTPTGQLLRVELPLAVPTIVAGVRIATVTTIGLVTVTALVGQGGLGRLILDGLTRDFRTPLVVGTALSVALAVAADLSLLGLERLLTPWSRRGT